MSNSNSLIGIGDLGKPMTVFIEKISNAIEGIAKPGHVRRIARAEADAEMIAAKSEIDITDLQRRALERFVNEEAKKQSNIESIIEKALPNVSEQSSPENMEDDWITNFFDKCRLISDEEMQMLWSRVLAGEANQPGNFSKRTVDTLASFDKFDAELFSKLCSFTVHIDLPTVLIYDTEATIYTDHGINFSYLKHLNSLGLIHTESVASYHRILSRQDFYYIHYFGKPLYISFPNQNKTQMDVGRVMFTQVGQQLSGVIPKTPIAEFENYLKQKWQGFGYRVEPDEIENNSV
ncbi:MAG: DUF2806 domain-containing protein [Trueperaceae bacterium]